MPDNKYILIVAVGDPMVPADQDALRPLIPSMKEAVRLLGGGTYSPKFDDYAVAPLGPTSNNELLHQAIQDHLGRQRPDVIFTVASEATKAARDVVRNDPRASGIPIVFTVVSEPDKEPHGDVFIPSHRVERITGVSRGLVQSAREAVKRFKDVIDRPLHVHWIYRRGLSQGDASHKKITDHPLGIAPTRHHPRTPDCDGMVYVIENELPANTSPHGPLTSLFLIPDDLVGSCAGRMIRSAHDPSRKIPTLVQQLEWVCRSPQDPMGPPALAGYGVTPEWVGTKAGGHVHKVILRADDAKSLPVLTPSDADREFWINLEVAGALGVPLVNPRPDWAIPCPGRARATAAAAKAKAAAPAAAKAPSKEPKKKAPAAKAKVSRKAQAKKRTPKPSKKAAARGKRTARRRKKK